MLQLTAQDIQAIVLSLKLASTVTVLLILLATPLAWWLAHSTSIAKKITNALVALPLVLPPTVLGFYLLIVLGPNGPIGHSLQSFGLSSLAFSFSGLVIASMLYSLPFVVMPLQNAFTELGSRPLEVAASLGAGPVDRFFSIVLPLCLPGFISAAVLGFAHTLGEFGIVLMIGGNIPGQTQVLSVLIYEQVESLNYASAHGLSLLLVIFSFLVIMLVYSLQGRAKNISGAN